MFVDREEINGVKMGYDSHVPSQMYEGVTLMKKRLLAAALVALLPLSLAACGGQSKQAACKIIND